MVLLFIKTHDTRVSIEQDNIFKCLFEQIQNKETNRNFYTKN